MNCIQCGAPLPEGASTCNTCGALVAGPAATAQPAAAPPASAPQPAVVPGSGYDGQPGTNAAAFAPPEAGGPSQPNGAPQQPVWQPAAPGGPPAAYPPPDEKKSKKKPLLIAVALLAAAAILVSLFVFVFDFRSPAQRARDAWNNTWATIAQEQQKNRQQLGLEAITAQLHGSPTRAEFGIVVEDRQAGALSAFSFTSTLHADLPQRRYDLAMGIGVGGTPLLNLEIGVDDDLIALACPELFEGSLGFYASTFGEDYNNSTFAEMNNLEIDADYFLSPVDALLDLTNPDGVPLLAGVSAKEMEKLDNRLWKEAEVTKTGNVAVDVNGVSQQCQAYKAMFPPQACAAYIQGLADVLAESGESGQSFSLLGLALPIAAGSSRAPQYYLGALADIVDEELEEMQVVFYVKNSCALRVEALAITAETDYALTLEFGGGNYLGNTITLTADDGEDVLVYEALGTAMHNDGVYSPSIRVLHNGEVMRSSEMFYDSNARQDNFEATITNPGGSKIIWAGTLHIDAGAKTLDLDLYNFRYSDIDDMGVSLRFSIEPDNYSFAPLDPAMLFEMNERELNALEDEIEHNISQIGNTLSQLI